MDVQGSAEQSQPNPSVMINGTPQELAAESPIRLIDIGISEDAYLFRVALPGVQKDGSLNCDIQRDGMLEIRGIVKDGGIAKDPSAYKMVVQQLGPPRPFTISFNLPGPVDPRLFSPKFRPDGILEVMVMKCVQAEGTVPSP